MSRPRLSAPRGRADVPPRPQGALSRWPKLGRTGSDSVRSGAHTLARTTASRIAPPTTTSGFQRTNWITRRSAIADARVDHRVERVDQQVDGHEDGGGDDQNGLYHGEVPEVDRVHDQLPHARPREDRLRDHRAAEERADLEPDHGQHRNGRVPERMAEDHDPLGESLGPAGPDVVAAQD